MNVSRRRLGGLAAAAALRPGRAAAALPQVRIGYTPLAEFLGAYVAKQEGMFERHGVDVSFVQIPLNPTIPSALIARSIEIGALNTAVFLLALDGGLDLVVVAGATVTPKGHGSFALVLRPDVPYRTPSDLAGMRILIPGLKSSVDVLFRRWLRGNGVDPDRVHYLELPTAQTPDALRGTSVDGAVIVEPYLTRVLQERIVRIGARFADELPTDILGTLYIAERRWVEENRQAVADFRAGLAEGTAYAIARPEQARADLPPYVKLPPAVLASIPYPSLEPTVTAAELQFWIDAMTAEGMLATRIDPGSLIPG